MDENREHKSAKSLGHLIYLNVKIFVMELSDSRIRFCA